MFDHARHNIVKNFHILFEEKDLLLGVFARITSSIGFGLINVFLPVFLYNQGLGISGVLLFYILKSLYDVIIALPASFFVKKFGPGWSLLVSAPFAALFYGLISFLNGFDIYFFVLPLFIAVRGVLFNISLHSTIIPALHENDSGKQLADISIISQISGYITPAFAGLIAYYTSFQTLFLVAAGVFALAAIPFLFIEKEHQLKDDINKKEFSKKVFSLIWKPERFFSFSGYAVPHTINKVCWSIFIITTIGGLVNLGFITTFSMLIGIFITYLFGFESDDGCSSSMLVYSSWMYTLLYSIRIFAYNPLTATILDSLRRPAFKALTVPWKKQMTSIAQHTGNLEFIVAREITYKISRVIILPLFASLFFLNMISLEIALVTASIGTLGIPLISKEYNNLIQ